MRTSDKIFDDIDYFLNPYYNKIKQLCEDEGLTFRRNYSIMEGSSKVYVPHKGYGNREGKVNTIWLTYYEDGFEVFGEIKIDLETKQLLIEFPQWQVYLQNNI